MRTVRGWGAMVAVVVAVLVGAGLALSLGGCAGNKAVRGEPADPGDAPQKPAQDVPAPIPAGGDEASPPDAKARPGDEAAPKLPAMPAVDPKTAAKDHGTTFVDRENGFTIGRPGRAWKFRPGEAMNTENIVVPLVMSDESTGAQVVVQVAPAVASPAQFAERLTSGLKSREGFATSEVQPIPLADGAVGFDFLVGDQVHGRVAIIEGSAGRVYVLLATWPRGSPEGVETDVDFILGSMKTGE
ncbi:MAG: hypothetical protein QM765_21165 [Myxococcales bacterium]